MALVCFINFFIQKMASLVHFKLSGMLSSRLRENIKCNIFLQPCNFHKSVKIMPWVTSMLPHHCKLTLSPHTIQGYQMPLSKIFSASTSNTIFWTKKVIKHTSAIQPHKEMVGNICFLRSCIMQLQFGELVGKFALRVRESNTKCVRVLKTHYGAISPKMLT